MRFSRVGLQRIASLIALLTAVLIATAMLPGDARAHAVGQSSSAESVQVGMAILIDNVDGPRTCTLGAIGQVVGESGLRGLTAGHCGQSGDVVYRWSPTSGTGPRLGELGRVTSIQAGDLAEIILDTDLSISPLVPFGDDGALPVLGAATLAHLADLDGTICSTGATTGFTCGPVAEVTDDVLRIDAPSAKGESGAGVYVRGRTGVYLAGIHVAKDGQATPVDQRVNRWQFATINILS